jgi:hypothetical protein
MIDSAPGILEEVDNRPGICRCGSPLAPGTRRLRVDGVPPRVAALFDAQRFCSGRCVRAYFLETLETLDSIYSDRTAAMVSDLHILYSAVAQTFAAMLRDPVLDS